MGHAVVEGVRHREWERKAKAGVFLCGVRIVSGRHPRLDSLWLPGEWKVSPGSLELGRIHIKVQSVESDSIRKGGRRDILDSADTVIVPIRTDSAVLEWSMLKRFSRRALEAMSDGLVSRDVHDAGSP